VNKVIQTVVDYAHRNHEQHVDTFKTFLRYPSISQDKAYQKQLEACADWLVLKMQRIGLENCQKIETNGHPIVYGDWLNAGDNQPTLLIYAHYDVQPIGDQTLWNTEPFEPTVLAGKLIARGTVDDKCGIWVNLTAIESILSVTDELPINIKLFFEGEEELGSPNVQTFVKQHKDLLSADSLIICDGPFSPKQPIIGYSVRGTIMGEVIVSGPPHDLHSGRYGGAVRNPIHHIADIISSLHDDDGYVAIEGFYDDILKMTERQRANLNRVWETIGKSVEDGAGVKTFWGQSMGTYAERTTSMPTLDVNGITGGHNGEGNKAIIPSQANFKVTIRLVPDQKPEVIWDHFVNHVMTFAGETVSIETKLLSYAYPFTMSDTGQEIEAIQSAFQSVVNKQALLLRHGGSLPIGGILQRELGIPTTMLGYGSGDHSHAPNEFIYFDDLQTAVDIAIHLFFNLGDVQ